jgi:hypothetical protein
MERSFAHFSTRGPAKYGTVTGNGTRNAGVNTWGDRCDMSKSLVTTSLNESTPNAVRRRANVCNCRRHAGLCSLSTNGTRAS